MCGLLLGSQPVLSGDRIAHSRHQRSRKPQVSPEPEDPKADCCEELGQVRTEICQPLQIMPLEVFITVFSKSGEQPFSNEILLSPF